MKNYLPNGEVVLHYAGGKREIRVADSALQLGLLLPALQPRGPVRAVWATRPLAGRLDADPPRNGRRHADALEIACDAAGVLESVELRATCSEGVLGLAGLTALSAEPGGQGPPR